MRQALHAVSLHMVPLASNSVKNTYECTVPSNLYFQTAVICTVQLDKSTATVVLPNAALCTKQGFGTFIVSHLDLANSIMGRTSGSLYPQLFCRRTLPVVRNACINNGTYDNKNNLYRVIAAYRGC